MTQSVKTYQHDFETINGEEVEVMYLAEIEVTQHGYEDFGTPHKSFHWIQVMKDGEVIPLSAVPHSIEIHLEEGAAEAFDWDAIAEINQSEWDRCMAIYEAEAYDAASYDLENAAA